MATFSGILVRASLRLDRPRRHLMGMMASSTVMVAPPPVDVGPSERTGLLVGCRLLQSLSKADRTADRAAAHRAGEVVYLLRSSGARIGSRFRDRRPGREAPCPWIGVGLFVVAPFSLCESAGSGSGRTRRTVSIPHPSSLRASGRKAADLVRGDASRFALLPIASWMWTFQTFA